MIKQFYIILILFILFSCKKGENDPAFSVLSRKERLTGKWELQEHVIENTYYLNGYDSNYIEEYFNEKLRITSLTKVEWDYKEYIEIRRDNSYKKTMEYDVTYDIEEGFWDFNKANKEKNLKNKESITFTIEKLSKIDKEDGLLWEKNYHDSINNKYIEQLDELKNNEMKNIYNDSSVTIKGIPYSKKGYKLYLKYSKNDK